MPFSENYQTAGQDYGRIAARAKVLSASPHQLVALLFEELDALLEELCLAERLEKHALAADRQQRAVTIIDSLIISLDHRKGPEIAATLARIYGWARACLLTADRRSRAEMLPQLRDTIAEIASAWRTIG